MAYYLKSKLRKEIYIDEEKRTIVCVLTGAETEAISRIQKIINLKFETSLRAICGKSFINDKYVGKAKCDPGDEWNEELGIELAEARAYAKFNLAMYNALDNFSDILGSAIDAIDDECCRYSELADDAENKAYDLASPD